MMRRYPLIEVIVTVGTWREIVPAYPDTGFEGGLSITAQLSDEILAEANRVPLSLANDEIGAVPAWDGSVEIDGHEFFCEVVELGSRCLLGREVLDQLSITFDFGQRLELRFGD